MGGYGLGGRTPFPRTGFAIPVVLLTNPFAAASALADGLGGLGAMTGMLIVYPLVLLGLICLPWWIWATVHFLKGSKQRTTKSVLLYGFSAAVSAGFVWMAMLLGFLMQFPVVGYAGVTAILLLTVFVLFGEHQDRGT